MRPNILLAALCLCGVSVSASAKTALTLYTSQPNEDAQMTVAAFEKAHPDIEVRWIRDGTPKLMARLQAELAAEAPAPDLLLIADSVTMESLKQQKLLAPYKSPEAARYDPALYDADGYYYGTKLITTGIAYHRQAPKAPASWRDLLDPALKNMTAMPSPLYSGAALIHLAALTDNAALGWEYYKGLKDNGVAPQGGNGAVLSALASGSKAYGVLVDYMAIREKAKGAPIEFVFPTEGVTLVTEPVAMMQGSRHPEEARAFIDFLLSRQGQELVLRQGYLPAHPDLPGLEGFPPRQQIKLMQLDAHKALADSERNKRRFSELFGAN